MPSFTLVQNPASRASYFPPLIITVAWYSGVGNQEAIQGDLHLSSPS